MQPQFFRDIAAEGQQSLWLASNLLDACTEFHRRMGHFLAASTQCDGSNYCCENDSALHCKSSRVLTRYLLSGRQFGAELHGYVFLTPASGKSNGGDERRDNDHASDVHGLLS